MAMVLVEKCRLGWPDNLNCSFEDSYIICTYAFVFLALNYVASAKKRLHQLKWCMEVANKICSNVPWLYQPSEETEAGSNPIERQGKIADWMSNVADHSDPKAVSYNV